MGGHPGGPFGTKTHTHPVMQITLHYACDATLSSYRSAACLRQRLWGFPTGFSQA